MANGKPGRPKGIPKTGGRAKGVLNKSATLAAAKLAKCEMTAEVVAEMIRRGAQWDIGDLYDANGDFKPLHELTEAQRMMIAGIEVVMKNAAAGDGKIDRVLKVKLVPRDRYVEMAAKYHSLLVEKVDVSVTEVGNRLERARQVAMERNAKKGGAK